MTFNYTTIIVALMLTFVTPIALAQQASSQLRFKASIPARCGIEVLDSQGELSFGDHYDSRETRLRVIYNIPERSFVLRLTHADFGELDNQIPLEKFRIQVDVPQRYEGDINYWRNGIVMKVDQLNEEQVIEIRARVDVNEEVAPAGDHTMRLDWEAVCL